MARGRPDYGVGSVQELIPKGEDVFELAVRLGSINAWTRTGTVFLTDTFKDGIYKWQKTVALPSYIIPSRKSAFFSPYVAKFYMNSPADELIYLYRMLPVFYDTPIGLEAYFACDGVRLQVELQIWIYFEGYLNIGTVEVDLDAKTIKIYDNILGWVTIEDSLNIFSSIGMFNVIKLIVNPVDGKYKAFKLNNKIYDLTDYVSERFISVTANHVNIYLSGHNSPGFIQELYWGGVIFTQNE